MAAVIKSEYSCAQCPESAAETSLAEGRVFFCRESLHYTDVLYVLRVAGTSESITTLFKSICLMNLDSSLMKSGASNMLSDVVLSVVNGSECKVLKDVTNKDVTNSVSAFDYLCESYTEHRYPFLVVTRKTPATAYKNYSCEFTYSLGTPYTEDSTEFARSELLDLLDKIPADDLVSLPTEI